MKWRVCLTASACFLSFCEKSELHAHVRCVKVQPHTATHTLQPRNAWNSGCSTQSFFNIPLISVTVCENWAVFTLKKLNEDQDTCSCRLHGGFTHRNSKAPSHCSPSVSFSLCSASLCLLFFSSLQEDESKSRTTGLTLRGGLLWGHFTPVYIYSKAQTLGEIFLNLQWSTHYHV